MMDDDWNEEAERKAKMGGSNQWWRKDAYVRLLGVMAR